MVGHTPTKCHHSQSFCKIVFTPSYLPQLTEAPSEPKPTILECQFSKEIDSNEKSIAQIIP